MSLVLDRVSKRYPRGERGVHERVALRGVSLEIESGELVAVLGRRRSGRTTLLQVAAGIEPPSEGTVRFAGVDLRDRSALGVEGGIGYCLTTFEAVLGDSVLEHVAAPAMAVRATPDAPARALDQLERAGVAACAAMRVDELDLAETIRVAIARASIMRPRLILLDEPTLGVRLNERDAILALIRSLAEAGVAVLMTVEEGAGLAGADRALTLDAGELRGETAPVRASVVPLRRNAGPSA
jgi:ABC-type multidrug transport system ATPase subunit